MKVVLSLEGDISGLKGWDRFAEKLTGLVEGGYTEVTVDLGNVERISSLALGTIMASHKKMKSAGRRLVLTNISEDFRKVAEAMGILETLNVE